MIIRLVPPGRAPAGGAALCRRRSASSEEQAEFAEAKDRDIRRRGAECSASPYKITPAVTGRGEGLRATAAGHT